MLQAGVGTDFSSGGAVPGTRGACHSGVLQCHIGFGHPRQQVQLYPSGLLPQVPVPRAQAHGTISGLCMTLNTLSYPLETSSLLSLFPSSQELLRS